jgi:hypothetical protein
MKARKLGKRLVFKRETIANLSDLEMKVARGGDWTDPVSCFTEPVCGSSWDFCVGTNCDTVCDWTEQAFCTIGCLPE